MLIFRQMAELCGRTMKLRDLARLSGLKISLLSMMLNGKRAATLRSIIALDKVLKVGKDRLITELERRYHAR